MDVVIVSVGYLMMTRSTMLRQQAVIKSKKNSARRRTRFYERQAQERLLFAMTMSLATARMSSTPRTIWTRERSSQWWERVVMETFTHQDWMHNFRMSRETFLFVCQELKSIEKRNTSMRKAIPLQKRVSIALWFLSTNSDFRTISHLFGVSKASVCLITKDVCMCIVDHLLPKYIRMPCGDALKQVVAGFKEKLGFPQCVGAIDGTHIPIISPQECPADYYNRKGWHSIILQGLVDHNGLFMDIYVGWPGRVHDARVFSNSSLFRKGQEGSLVPTLTEMIEQCEIPLVILGDPAYPLLKWLMKAYPDTGRLTLEQKTFNYRLSKARVVVEHAYGRLKARWRCLMKRNDTNICDIPNIVSACCVLHNICELRGESFDDEWIESDSSFSMIRQSASDSVDISGDQIRSALTQYFST